MNVHVLRSMTAGAEGRLLQYTPSGLRFDTVRPRFRYSTKLLLVVFRQILYLLPWRLSRYGIRSRERLLAGVLRSAIGGKLSKTTEL